MCITLKEIGKILFALVLRILPICKVLNLTSDFKKKKKNQTFQSSQTIVRV